MSNKTNADHRGVKQMNQYRKAYLRKSMNGWYFTKTVTITLRFASGALGSWSGWISATKLRWGAFRLQNTIAFQEVKSGGLTVRLRVPRGLDDRLWSSFYKKVRSGERRGNQLMLIQLQSETKWSGTTLSLVSVTCDDSLHKINRWTWAFPAAFQRVFKGIYGIVFRMLNIDGNMCQQ